MDATKKKIEAAGMNSPEGEYVPFQTPVLTEGPVEYWMLAVEAAMRLTLKKILYQTTTSMKGIQDQRTFNMGKIHVLFHDLETENSENKVKDIFQIQWIACVIGTKKEKWLSDWPGQLLITAGKSYFQFFSNILFHS